MHQSIKKTTVRCHTASHPGWICCLFNLSNCRTEYAAAQEETGQLRATILPEQRQWSSTEMKLRWVCLNLWGLIFEFQKQKAQLTTAKDGFPLSPSSPVTLGGAALQRSSAVWRLWRVRAAHLLQVINHHSFMRLWVFRRDSGSPLLLLPAIHPATR